MGVRGLWEIARPIARPVTLESLARKKLAVDASIWIYQFLKAVRDSEGNALKNAHIIGFFRRICKLLYFDIKPVFVFDGDAPTLKKSTINRRRERRQGRRAAAAHTAAKLLSLQLQRLAADKEHNKDKDVGNKETAVVISSGDEIPENVVYFDQRNETLPHAASTSGNLKPFRPQDEYHLPEVGNNLVIDSNDPRLMTEEELAEYASEFGEQINSGLYDTSLVDFESPEFHSLPATTQYQLLNTARLRSRLRMGYSADQLDKMFPNRMEFSKFQIERVTQRNFLTQRVMGLVGLEEDLSRRVAGEKAREYILKRNENGWTLDLENKKNDEVIVLDDNNGDSVIKKEQETVIKKEKTRTKNEDEDEDDDDIDFEDVPLEEEVQLSQPINVETSFPRSHANDESFLPESLNDFEALVKRQQLYDKLQKKESTEVAEKPVKVIKPLAMQEETELTKLLKSKSLLFAPGALDATIPHTAENAGLEKTPTSISASVPASATTSIVLPPWFIDDEDDSDKNNDNKDGKFKNSISVPGISTVEEEEDGSGLISYELGKKILDERHVDTEELMVSRPSVSVIEISDEEEGLEIRIASDADAADAFVDVPSVIAEFVETPNAHDIEVQRLPNTAIDSSEQDSAAPGIGIQLPKDEVEEEQEGIEWEESDYHDDDQQQEIKITSSVPSAIESTSLDPDELELAEEDAKYDEQEDEELTENLLQELEESERFTKALNNGLMNDKSKEEYELEIEVLRQQHQKEARDADQVTQTMVSECQELLRRFGIPYITAPMEAEAQCAVIMKLGLVDGIITDDSDCFLFGGERVYKNMFNQAKYVECYESKDLEREFDLDRSKLIKLAQLLGSDYTDGLPGVGPVSALELLAEFNTEDGLQRFREWWKKVQSVDPTADFSTEFRKKFKRHASKLFLSDNFPDANVENAYLDPIVDDDATPFEWGIPDLDSLRTFLLGMTGWNKEKVDEMLLPVIQDINKRRQRLEKSSRALIQSSLTDYAGVSARKRVEIGGSKRVRKAMQSLIDQAESRKKQKK